MSLDEHYEKQRLVAESLFQTGVEKSPTPGNDAAGKELCPPPSPGADNDGNTGGGPPRSFSNDGSASAPSANSTTGNITGVGAPGNGEDPKGAQKAGSDGCANGSPTARDNGTAADSVAALAASNSSSMQAKQPITQPPPYRRPDWEDQPIRPHNAYPQAQLLQASPRVLITPDAYKAMCLYVEIGPLEVGWQGAVSRTASGDFLIEKTYLLEQEVTGTETELSVDARFKLAFELTEKGDEGIDEANRMRFWGHSHVRMGTSPSGTDERTMDQFAREGCPWYVRGIFNKLGSGSFTIYLYEIGLRINDAPWAVWDPDTQKVILDRPSFTGGYGSFWSYGRSLWSNWGRREEQPVANAGSADNPVAPGTTAGANRQSSAPGITDGVDRQSAEVGIADGVDGALPERKAPGWLPGLLVPSAELRARIQSEYNAKVKERRGYFTWMRSLQANEDPSKVGAAIEQSDSGTNSGGNTSGDSSTRNDVDKSAGDGTSSVDGTKVRSDNDRQEAGSSSSSPAGKRPAAKAPGSNYSDPSPTPPAAASGRADLTGYWIPAEWSSPARPMKISQKDHYVSIELVNRAGECVGTLTGAYLQHTFKADGWAYNGYKEITVTVMREPDYLQVEDLSGGHYFALYKRGNPPEPSSIKPIVDFLKDMFKS